MTVSRPPRPLLVVVALLGLQALAAAALGLAFVVDLLRGSARDVIGTGFIAAFLVLVAVVLVVAGRALLRGRRWARGPVMTAQIFLAILAVSWWRSEPSWWSAAAFLAAVAVGVSLVLPSVVAATTVPRPAEPDAHAGR